MTINSVIELDAVTLSEDENNGQKQGRPGHAGEQGRPDHAGEQGPPDHAPAHGRRRRDEEDEAEYAWVGVSPETIEGETNPTISLVAGEEYTVEWTNTTGTDHNFVIVDDDGEEIIASDGTSEEGETETVEFTATEEMAAYYSDSHPDQMQGEIDVEEAPEAVFEVSDLDPVEAIVEEGESFDVSATITNTGDGDGTQEITLLIDDDSVESQELSLDSDDSDTVTFENVETADFAPGEYSYTVATEDDDASGTLVVEESTEEVLWHRDHEWETNPEEATNWDNYEVHDLGQEASGELMSVDAGPQGRIWYIGRGADFVTHGDDVAEVCYVDPDSGDHQIALELDVIVGAEEVTGGNARELGGQGVAVDPDFEQNGYVYVYYHPSSEDFDLIENPYHEDITTMLQRVSRFEMDGDVLDPDSEEVLIEIPLQLETCCHIGGHLEFGPEGDLYISTGDDSNNVGAPHRPEIDYFMGDERDGIVGDRPAAVSDAQRTSGNTSDLRGSVLRITPTDDGSYEIPDGNLKEWWEEEAGETYDEDEFLPELYVMGVRNPFTITVDEHTGFLFIGDYGNDAPSWDHDHGTVGQATYHLFDEPGNVGYPFFKGYYPNRYRDFELEEPGQPFWFDNLRNRSPNNTGIENIPNVTPAVLWHPQSFDTYEDVAPWADMPRPGEITWPQLDEGGSADAGVAYRYSDDFGEGALDPYFEAKQFFMNPSNADVIRYLTFNEDGSLDIEEFLPDNDIASTYDMDVLPDGRLVAMGMYSGIHLVEYLEDGQPDEPEEPEALETPWGLNNGNEGGTYDSVEIDGLTFDDDVPDEVTVLGDVNTSERDETDVEGTDYDELYLTEHWGSDLGFEIPVDEGTYSVTLHWAETWFGSDEQDGGEGDRVFDVTINDELVLEEFDPYAEAGDAFVAVPQTFTVEAPDEVISIETESHEDNTMFNGVEIRPAEDDDDPEIPEEAIEPGTAIELDGQTGGWIGIAPEEIDGEENPTLVLAEGEEYELGWTTGDGGAHNIEIRNEDGDVVGDLSTEITSDPDDQWLQFEASSEMAEYVCAPHEGTMSGEIDVQ